jgi:hypothetical protein
MSASGNEDFCAPTQLDGFVNAVTTFLTTDPSRDDTKIAAASAIAGCSASRISMQTGR